MPVSKIEAAAAPNLPDRPYSADPDGLVPLALLQNSLRFWWVLLVLAVAGGLLGWLVHQLKPPVYEATGRFSASIDYVLTGPLTQFEEDSALNAVGDLLDSRPVVDTVIEKAAIEGIQTSRIELLEMSTIERRFTIWELRIRHTDPQLAERITNIWVEEAQAYLLESYEHAIQAQQLNRYMQSLESCLARSVASETSHTFCNPYRFKDVLADMEKAGRFFYRERVASHGLFAGVTIGPADPAVLTGRPVLYQRNQLVLAGGLLGLLAGVWLVQLNVPGRWVKSR